MSVLIKEMEMPTECHGCRWFYFQGTSCTEPKYYLDARCEMVESGQDWYGKDARGGWIGESIEHIPGWSGNYSHQHCVEMGTRASQCPLCDLPSAQPETHEERTETHACDCISRQATIDEIEERKNANGYRNVAVISELNRLEGYIMRLPSAQPEIVACGDCKHWICHDRRCGYWNHGVKPLDWCCHAERRTDG